MPQVVGAQGFNPLPEDLPPVGTSDKSVTDTYSQARVEKILESGEKKQEDGAVQKYQKVSLEILNGPDAGKRIVVDHGSLFAIDTSQLVKQGDVVVLTKPGQAAKSDFYYITDFYRVGRLMLVVGIFFLVAIIFGRWRGFTAVLGLIFTAFVLFYGIAPRILAGHNPLVTCIVGGSIILVVSLYISHGFNRRTSLALVASLSTLILTIGINYAFVLLTKLSGNGTEEAFYLQYDSGSIDLRGLLLGGIIIGVLGVLDDVTTAQTAAVEEVAKANPNLTFHELYRSGLSVGREHIASLVNTLVLAYVGASFPLILLYALHQVVPLWLMINSNFIAEEIVRTMVGSVALVVAVPISTILSAYWFSRHPAPAH
jgi:uncharacterized membrane protein